jgi:hypothetical protein
MASDRGTRAGRHAQEVLELGAQNPWTRSSESSICMCLCYFSIFYSSWRIISLLQYTKHSSHTCDLMFHKF